MAYDKDTYRRFHSFGLTSDASVLLATFLHDLDADIGTIEDLGLTPAAAVEDIEDTSIVADVGDKVNELLAALRAAGLMEASE